MDDCDHIFTLRGGRIRYCESCRAVHPDDVEKLKRVLEEMYATARILERRLFEGQKIIPEDRTFERGKR